MNKLLLISLMLLVSFASVDFASAVSVYDDVYQTTDDLTITGRLSDNTLCSIDVTNDWVSYIVNSPPSNGHDIGASFSNALSNGGSWSVTWRDFGNDVKRLYVAWTETETPDIIFGYNNQVYWDSYGAYDVMLFPTLGNSCSVGVQGLGAYDSHVYQALSVLNDDTYKNFLSMGNVVYPQGYVGRQIRSEYFDKTDIVSRFDVVKTGTEITVTPTGFSPDVSQGLKVCHKIIVYSSDNVIVIDKTIGRTSEMGLIHDLKDYGTYNLTVVPIDCGVPYESISQVYNPIFTRIDIVVDGSSGVFQSSELCDASGYCNTSGLEDCADLDIVCELRNLGKQITTTLYNLFVPTKGQILMLYDRFLDFMNVQFGFLWFPFDFFINLFTQFANATDSCTFTTSQVPGSNVSGTFFGSTVSLSVCSAEQDSPQIYNLVVFIIRLVVVSTLIWALFYRITQFYLEGKSGMYGNRGRYL